MSFRRAVTNFAGSVAARRATPALAGRGLRQALERGIDGFTGFAGAREVARKHLERRREVDRAVRDTIDQHVRLAGAQGFVTNIGGVVTMAVAIPANLAGIALLQVRMVAVIAHLRGYELSDPKVRAAVLLTLLGEDGIREARKEGDLDVTAPRDLAVAAEIDPAVLDRVTAQVGQSLVTRVGGKHATLTVTKRVPVVGGAVSAGVDAYSTYSVGRFADRQFTPHTMIERA